MTDTEAPPTTPQLDHAYVPDITLCQFCTDLGCDGIGCIANLNPDDVDDREALAEFHSLLHAGRLARAQPHTPTALDVTSLYEWAALVKAAQDARPITYQVWSRNLAIAASTFVRVVIATMPLPVEPAEGCRFGCSTVCTHGFVDAPGPSWPPAADEPGAEPGHCDTCGARIISGRCAWKPEHVLALDVNDPTPQVNCPPAYRATDDDDDPKDPTLVRCY